MRLLRIRTFRSVNEVEDIEIELNLKKNPINAAISECLAVLLAVDREAGMHAQRPLSDREAEGMTACCTTVSFEGKQFRDSAYVRDIDCHGFVAHGLAEQLSELAALKAAVRTVKKCSV
jgi:hypothetical protein